MQVPTHATKKHLAGSFLSGEERFRIDIYDKDIAEDPPGAERSQGFIVDDKWPNPGHLGQKRTPLRLCVRSDQLRNALFVGDLLVRMLEQAKSQKSIDIDTHLSD
jgi:hypothetical protein